MIRLTAYQTYKSIYILRTTITSLTQMEDRTRVETSNGGMWLVNERADGIYRLTRSKDENVDQLLAACRFGSGSLLHNSGGLLEEFAKGHKNEGQFKAMAEVLKKKGQMENDALANFPTV